MFKKLGEYVLGAMVGCALWGLLITGYQVVAGQSSLFSPTTGTVSGLQLTNNYNSALDSLNTCSSGTTAPTNQLSGSPSLGNCWLDTSTAGFPKIKVYDGTSWLVTGILDTTNHVYFQPAGGGLFANITLTAGATTDLCQSAQYLGSFIILSGTATINSFGSTCPQGTIKTVVFTGSQTLTQNATSMVLDTGVTYAPQGGDYLTFATDGLGNWFQEGYHTRNVVTCAAGTPSSSFTVFNGQVTHC